MSEIDLDILIEDLSTSESNILISATPQHHTQLDNQSPHNQLDNQSPHNQLELNHNNNSNNNNQSFPQQQSQQQLKQSRKFKFNRFLQQLTPSSRSQHNQQPVQQQQSQQQLNFTHNNNNNTTTTQPIDAESHYQNIHITQHQSNINNNKDSTSNLHHNQYSFSHSFESISLQRNASYSINNKQQQQQLQQSIDDSQPTQQQLTPTPHTSITLHKPLSVTSDITPLNTTISTTTPQINHSTIFTSPSQSQQISPQLPSQQLTINMSRNSDNNPITNHNKFHNPYLHQNQQQQQSSQQLPSSQQSTINTTQQQLQQQQEQRRPSQQSTISQPTQSSSTRSTTSTLQQQQTQQQQTQQQQLQQPEEFNSNRGISFSNLYSNTTQSQDLQALYDALAFHAQFNLQCTPIGYLPEQTTQFTTQIPPQPTSFQFHSSLSKSHSTTTSTISTTSDTNTSFWSRFISSFIPITVYNSQHTLSTDDVHLCGYIIPMHLTKLHAYSNVNYVYIHYVLTLVSILTAEQRQRDNQLQLEQDKLNEYNNEQLLKLEHQLPLVTDSGQIITTNMSLNEKNGPKEKNDKNGNISNNQSINANNNNQSTNDSSIINLPELQIPTTIPPTTNQLQQSTTLNMNQNMNNINTTHSQHHSTHHSTLSNHPSPHSATHSHYSHHSHHSHHHHTTKHKQKFPYLPFLPLLTTSNGVLVGNERFVSNFGTVPLNLHFEFIHEFLRGFAPSSEFNDTRDIVNRFKQLIQFSIPREFYTNTIRMNTKPPLLSTSQPSIPQLTHIDMNNNKNGLNSPQNVFSPQPNQQQFNQSLSPIPQSPHSTLSVHSTHSQYQQQQQQQQQLSPNGQQFTQNGQNNGQNRQNGQTNDNNNTSRPIDDQECCGCTGSNSNNNNNQQRTINSKNDQNQSNQVNMTPNQIQSSQSPSQPPSQQNSNNNSFSSTHQQRQQQPQQAQSQPLQSQQPSLDQQPSWLLLDDATTTGQHNNNNQSHFNNNNTNNNTNNINTTPNTTNPTPTPSNSKQSKHTWSNLSQKTTNLIQKFTPRANHTPNPSQPVLLQSPQYGPPQYQQPNSVQPSLSVQTNFSPHSQQQQMNSPGMTSPYHVDLDTQLRHFTWCAWNLYYNQSQLLINFIKTVFLWVSYRSDMQTPMTMVTFKSILQSYNQFMRGIGKCTHCVGIVEKQNVLLETLYNQQQQQQLQYNDINTHPLDPNFKLTVPTTISRQSSLTSTTSTMNTTNNNGTINPKSRAPLNIVQLPELYTILSKQLQYSTQLNPQSNSNHNNNNSSISTINHQYDHVGSGFQAYADLQPPPAALSTTSTTLSTKQQSLSLTSDTGWGCMLRSAQMLLSTALSFHFSQDQLLSFNPFIHTHNLALSRHMSNCPSPTPNTCNTQEIIPSTNPPTSLLASLCQSSSTLNFPLNSLRNSLQLLLQDSLHGAYSIHAMLLHRGEGRAPGQWYSPSEASFMLYKIVQTARGDHGVPCSYEHMCSLYEKYNYYTYHGLELPPHYQPLYPTPNVVHNKDATTTNLNNSTTTITPSQLQQQPSQTSSPPQQQQSQQQSPSQLPPISISSSQFHARYKLSSSGSRPFVPSRRRYGVYTSTIRQINIDPNTNEEKIEYVQKINKQSEIFINERTQYCQARYPLTFGVRELSVCVCNDGEVYYHSILRRMLSRGAVTPTLVLVNVCLGLSHIEQRHYQTFLQMFKLCYNVGAIGGVKNSSLYFYGSQGERIFYLDPHTTQKATTDATSMQDIDSTYQFGILQSVPIKDIDPSLAFGFYLPSIEALSLWFTSFKEIMANTVPNNQYQTNLNLAMEKYDYENNNTNIIIDNDNNINNDSNTGIHNDDQSRTSFSTSTISTPSIQHNSKNSKNSKSSHYSKQDSTKYNGSHVSTSKSLSQQKNSVSRSYLSPNDSKNASNDKLHSSSPQTSPAMSYQPEHNIGQNGPNDGQNDKLQSSQASNHSQQRTNKKKSTQHHLHSSHISHDVTKSKYYSQLHQHYTQFGLFDTNNNPTLVSTSNLQAQFCTLGIDRPIWSHRVDDESDIDEFEQEQEEYRHEMNNNNDDDCDDDFSFDDDDDDDDDDNSNDDSDDDNDFDGVGNDLDDYYGLNDGRDNEISTNQPSKQSQSNNNKNIASKQTTTNSDIDDDEWDDDIASILPRTLSNISPRLSISNNNSGSNNSSKRHSPNVSNNNSTSTNNSPTHINQKNKNNNKKSNNSTNDNMTPTTYTTTKKQRKGSVIEWKDLSSDDDSAQNDENNKNGENNNKNDKIDQEDELDVIDSSDFRPSIITTEMNNNINNEVLTLSNNQKVNNSVQKQSNDNIHSNVNQNGNIKQTNQILTSTPSIKNSSLRHSTTMSDVEYLDDHIYAELLNYNNVVQNGHTSNNNSTFSNNNNGNNDMKHNNTPTLSSKRNNNNQQGSQSQSQQQPSQQPKIGQRTPPSEFAQLPDKILHSNVDVDFFALSPQQQQQLQQKQHNQQHHQQHHAHVHSTHKPTTKVPTDDEDSDYELL